MIGEVRIPMSQHKDIAIEYSVQHWFPLFNAKCKKSEGSPGELGLRVGARGGDVSVNPIFIKIDHKLISDQRLCELLLWGNMGRLLMTVLQKKC